MTKLIDAFDYLSIWTIRRFASDEMYAMDEPYDVTTIEGNLLLNEGIARLLDAGIGAVSTNAVWNSTNTFLGVGISTAAAVATQTALQGASPTFVAMDGTFPSRSAQTVTWRSTYTSAIGNHVWSEFTVAITNDAGINLNRLQSDQGTKISGQTWELSLQFTLS